MTEQDWQKEIQRQSEYIKIASEQENQYCMSLSQEINQMADEIEFIVKSYTVHRSYVFNIVEGCVR